MLDHVLKLGAIRCMGSTVVGVLIRGGPVTPNYSALHSSETVRRTPKRFLGSDAQSTCKRSCITVTSSVGLARRRGN